MLRVPWVKAVMRPDPEKNIEKTQTETPYTFMFSFVYVYSLKYLHKRQKQGFKSLQNQNYGASYSINIFEMTKKKKNYTKGNIAPFRYI